ncbi:hypothetical protein HYT84_02435 [Candidatus Micrarchaeota archaeon]|nr:hypothetical protein [Candidatus Micrarchaeota archaeon]
MVQEDNIYKSNVNAGFRKELAQDLEKNLGKFNDPVVLGEMLYKLLEERENTNRILKNILAKLDALEEKGVKITEKEDIDDLLIPEIDEGIISFIRKAGKATAEDVRKEFNYKGRNGASARLNRLCELQLLWKKQVGKKVYFMLR